MLYLDSSIAVALLVNEPHSERADSWLFEQKGRELALSRWVETEVAAALSAKVRLGALNDQLLAEARTRFSDVKRSSRRLSIGTQHFRLAAQFAAVVNAKLTGADALHVAIAAEAGAVLSTLDQRQADAAKVLDVAFHLI